MKNDIYKNIISIKYIKLYYMYIKFDALRMHTCAYINIHIQIYFRHVITHRMTRVCVRVCVCHTRNNHLK